MKKLIIIASIMNDIVINYNDENDFILNVKKSIVDTIKNDIENCEHYISTLHNSMQYACYNERIDIRNEISEHDEIHDAYRYILDNIDDMFEIDDIENLISESFDDVVLKYEV